MTGYQHKDDRLFNLLLLTPLIAATCFIVSAGYYFYNNRIKQSNYKYFYLYRKTWSLLYQ